MDVSTEDPEFKASGEVSQVDPNIRVAANKLLQWQRDHIAASEHNLVVSTVYALTSHYKDTVAVMPKLVFYATMNTSGKTTAGQVVKDVGNFSPEARTVTKLSGAGIIRLANTTKKGVAIEDAHRFASWDPIFGFMVNSFPRDGVHIVADQKNQAKLVAYNIGGTPIVVTTNKVGKLDQDALRRSILLPMMRSKPKKKAPKVAEERARQLGPFWEVFDRSTIHHVPHVEAHLDDPMPDWMGEDQKDRWTSLFAVSHALLGEGWTKSLEEAARHLEGVTYTPNETQQLLMDIWAVREANPDTIGVLPAKLYDALREENPDVWGEMSDTKLGRLVREIRDGDGRRLEQKNVPTHAAVVGLWKPGAKHFPWAHFEAAWAAYGIGKRPDNVTYLSEFRQVNPSE